MTLHPVQAVLPPSSPIEGVSIVIPVYNALDLTAECIASIYSAHTVAPFEVIVVDNGSDEQAALAWLASEGTRPNFYFLRYDAPLGFARAVNTGVRHARGKYVVLLNSDTRVTDGWLDALVDVIDRDPQLAVVSPVTNHTGSVLQQDEGAVSLQPDDAPRYAEQIRERTRVDYTREHLAFFCVMVRRVVWELIGGLDEGYRTGNYEDNDYCLRVQTAGYRLAVVKHSFVYHHSNSTFIANKLNHGEWMTVNERRFYDRASRLAAQLRPTLETPRADDITVLLPVTGGESDDLPRALNSLAAGLLRPESVIVITTSEQDAANTIPFNDAFRLQVILLPRTESPVTLASLLEAGRAHVTTRYVTVLRADEIAYPMHLAVLHELAARTSARVIYSRWVVVDTSAAELRRGTPDNLWYSVWRIPDLSIENHVLLSCVLHETACYAQIGGYDTSLTHHAEWDFILRLVNSTTPHVTRAATVERWQTADPLRDFERRQVILTETRCVYDRYPVTDATAQEKRAQNLAAITAGHALTDVLPRAEGQPAARAVPTAPSAPLQPRKISQRRGARRIQSMVLGLGRAAFERAIPSYDARVRISNAARRALGIKQIRVSNTELLRLERRNLEAANASGTFDGSFPSTSDKPDVFLFNIIEWSSLTQRPHHFARGLAARGYRVFWVDVQLKAPHPDVPWHNGGVLPQLAPNLYWLRLPGTLHDVYQLPAHLYTDGTFAAAVDFVRRAYAVKQAVCLVNYLNWTPLVLHLREQYGWKVVYDCLDNAAAFSEMYGTTNAANEEKLARASDKVIASAQFLIDKLRPNAQPILIRNATDYDVFSSAASNGLLKALSRPVIGFFGAFSEWLDLDLITYVAHERPDWSFVFIGRATFPTAEGADRWKSVGELANVHVYPQVDQRTLAAYMTQFDVCTLPFRDLPITQAMNAVKIYEYLAGGKPVVAAALSETIPLAEQGLIAVYRTRDEYLAALDNALMTQDQAKTAARQAFAQQNTWAHRVDVLSAQIDELFDV